MSMEIWSEPEWVFVVLKLGAVRVGWYLGALRLSVWRVR